MTGIAQQPHNPNQTRQGIPENEPKRGNLLEFKNFRMVNVTEPVSKSQSLTSLTSLNCLCF